MNSWFRRIAKGSRPASDSLIRECYDVHYDDKGSPPVVKQNVILFRQWGVVYKHCGEYAPLAMYGHSRFAEDYGKELEERIRSYPLGLTAINGLAPTFQTYDSDVNMWVTHGETMVARCRRTGRHMAPVPFCRCGLYGYHPDYAARTAMGRVHFGDALLLMGQCTGVVQVSGRMEVHHGGIRAEKAVVKALIGSRRDTFTPLMCSKLGLDFIPLAGDEILDAIDAAKPYGEPFPVKLRPKRDPDDAYRHPPLQRYVNSGHSVGPTQTSSTTSAFLKDVYTPAKVQQAQANYQQTITNSAQIERYWKAQQIKKQP